ncbi:hypothetical protein ISALK_00820 [Isachenkonia alkalipeptolytica]|uniref:Uncharacterized protein n=1 Tax=Isachenkonia alkalipeptolytica TaxID=2565777 RepID=A0AA43XHP2_9CLOT|nr:hypothetical protein [Isachenkonia alkalipeptolytica]
MNNLITVMGFHGGLLLL